MARVVARFAEPVNDDPMAVAAHQVKEFAPRFTLGCSVSTPPQLAMAMLDHARHLGSVRQSWPHLAIFHAVVRAGRGRVVAVPGLAEPLVGYRLGPAGFTDLAAGMRALARLLLHAGAARVYPGMPGARAIEGERDVERLPSTLAATGATLLSLHLVGSCRMGEHAGASVTDSFGRLRGADGLHLADASVLCDAPGVNPQGTIMAFARRNVLSALRKL
jgi:choline dehydrogenase-like flavoprotein